MLLTAPVGIVNFLINHKRDYIEAIEGRTGLSILSAVLLGFALYYVRNFAQVMGENGQLSPILAAWIPPVASVLLAENVIVRVNDGTADRFGFVFSRRFAGLRRYPDTNRFLFGLLRCLDNGDLFVTIGNFRLPCRSHPFFGSYSRGFGFTRLFGCP